MTASRSVSRKDVERVFASLQHALLAEYPEQAYLIRVDPREVPAPQPGTRTYVLWVAFKLAFTARARFVRQASVTRANKRGERLPMLDDKRRDKAIKSLERAVSHAEAAVRALSEDLEAMESRHGVKVPQAQRDLQVVTLVAEELVAALTEVRKLNGVYQIRTQREWDEFISKTAAALLDKGMPSKKVASILTGLPARKIDRAELERFRQRVRRLKVSGSYERTEGNSSSYADFAGM